jgi:hypothetical protein
MKKVLISVLTIALLASISLMPGCEVNPLTGTQVMKGTVKNIVSNLPISNVRISSTPGLMIVTSDTAGKFIMTGLSTYTYTFTASKQGYFTVSFNQNITAGDTARVNVQMGLAFFRFDTLFVHEYFNNNSLSAVNLYSAYVTQESDGTKDIQMRDSAGLSQRFCFGSGNLALDYSGFETKFTEPLMSARSFTKAEFDTLSKLYPSAGTLDPVNDFPNNYTRFYPTNINGLNHVYGFYLKGRYESNQSAPRVYGMIYIKSIISSGTEKIFAVDIKINRNGENSFNLYP